MDRGRIALRAGIVLAVVGMMVVNALPSVATTRTCRGVHLRDGGEQFGTLVLC
jgi:hypothetical protein